MCAYQLDVNILTYGAISLTPWNKCVKSAKFREHQDSAREKMMRVSVFQQPESALSLQLIKECVENTTYRPCLASWREKDFRIDVWNPGEKDSDWALRNKCVKNEILNKFRTPGARDIIVCGAMSLMRGRGSVENAFSKKAGIFKGESFKLVSLETTGTYPKLPWEIFCGEPKFENSMLPE